MTRFSETHRGKRRQRTQAAEILEQRQVLSVSAVSLRVDGLDTGNVGATFSQQSDDGRYVVFRSSATNLVAGVNDVNGFNSDIFRRDRLTGKTELVSVSRHAANQTPNGPSMNAYISGNGRYVVFESDASDLVPNDTNGGFLGDPRDVFVRDMVAKKTILVSVNRFGKTSQNARNMIRESDQTDGRFISDNGRYVVFQSRASDLVVGDNNNARDVFVRDIVEQKTYLVNVNNAGQAGNGPSEHGVISANGRFVAFESSARNLVPNDTNFNLKIFRHDLQTRRTVLVSSNDLQNGALITGGSYLPKMNGSGRFITFESTRRLSAADANNSNRDIYVRDMQKTGPDLVSINRTGGPANSVSFDPNISKTGRYVVFESMASNLTADDRDPANPALMNNLAYKDVFRRDLQTGITELVSRNFLNTRSATGESRNISVSGNGRIVAWESQALNLVQGFRKQNDSRFDFDVFRRDMVTGVTTLVSHQLNSATRSGNSGSFFPVVSVDGRFISFHGRSTNLIARDTNSGNGGTQTDVFVGGPQYTSRTVSRSASIPLPVPSSLFERQLDDLFAAADFRTH